MMTSMRSSNNSNNNSDNNISGGDGHSSSRHGHGNDDGGGGGHSAALDGSAELESEEYYLEKLRELQIMSRHSLNLSIDELDKRHGGIGSREAQLRSDLEQFNRERQMHRHAQHPHTASGISGASSGQDSSSPSAAEAVEDDPVGHTSGQRTSVRGIHRISPPSQSHPIPLHDRSRSSPDLSTAGIGSGSDDGGKSPLFGAQRLLRLFRRGKGPRRAAPKRDRTAVRSGESLLRRLSMRSLGMRRAVSGDLDASTARRGAVDLSLSPAESYSSHHGRKVGGSSSSSSSSGNSNSGGQGGVDRGITISTLSREAIRSPSSSSSSSSPLCGSPTAVQRPLTPPGTPHRVDPSAQMEFDLWMSQFDSANNAVQQHAVDEYNCPLTHDELSSFVAKFCLLAPEQDGASSALLRERGTLYVKQLRGHFEPRFAELCNSEILFWNSERDYAALCDPIARYPLDIAFSLHRIGTTTVMAKHRPSHVSKRKSGGGNGAAASGGGGGGGGGVHGDGSGNGADHAQRQQQQHLGDMLRGHVCAIVPNDRERHELVLCIPDDDAYDLWIQCLDLHEIISFSTLQFSAPLSRGELLEHSIVDEYVLFCEQSHTHGDAPFSRVLLDDYKGKVQQLSVCPF